MYYTELIQLVIELKEKHRDTIHLETCDAILVIDNKMMKVLNRRI